MPATYTIYKVTNLVNNKVYVGFTSNFKRRKQEHLREVRYGKRNYPLYNALRAYGLDYFTWEVLYQSKDQEHTLTVIEPKLIKEHNAYVPHGYNTADGGTAPMLNKKHSEATILKMKKRVPWNKGKHFSEEARRNMSAAHKGRPYNPTQCKNQGISNSCWWRITEPNGSIITIKGIKAYCKENNLSSGNMSRLASGGIKYYKGYSCINLGKSYISSP